MSEFIYAESGGGHSPGSSKAKKPQKKTKKTKKKQRTIPPRDDPDKSSGFVALEPIFLPRKRAFL